MAQAGVLDPSAAPARLTSGSSTADERGERPAARWIALVVFAAVTALGIRAHTLWFDELQAWNIARASHSLGDLASNLRYEGHPILWYLPLFVLSRVTGNPHVMQLQQFAIAVSTAGLVLFRAPLRFSLRVALLAGYFVAFEYGVFSRSYGLGALLLVAALVCLARPAPRWPWATAALVALAFTSLPGAVLAVAIAVSILLDPALRRLACARALAVVVVVSTAAVAVVCIPPDDFGNLTPGIGDSSRFGTGVGVRVASSASAIWRALVPLPATLGEWNSNLLDRQAGAVRLEALLSIGLFVVVLVALGRHVFARRLWWVGSAGLFAFFLVVTRPEAARHSGFAFLLFVACVWLAYSPPNQEENADGVTVSSGGRDALGAIVVVVLAAQILAMLAVYPTASTEDFSRDRALADAVHHARLDDVIVSAQDWDATTIGGYLDRSVWSIARGERIRFLTTDARQQRGQERLDTSVVECAAVQRANERGRAVALVVAGRLPGRTPFVVSDGAVVYRIEPGAVPEDCG